MTAPLVSVVIPAFNPGALLNATLDSVLAQTHPRVEVIVVDDGSTDDTPERLAAYAGRVRRVRQANAGGGAARNAGLRLARGAYVCFLDHDDLWEPETVARQLEVSARHPASVLVACDGRQVGTPYTPEPPLLFGPLAERLRATGGSWSGPAGDALLEANAIGTPGQVLLPREALDAVGPLSEGRDEPTDYDLWLRLARRGPVTLHDARLVRWRYRASSRSGPAALRPLRWALLDLPVLARALQAAPPAERRAVRRALARRTRTARLAWWLGTVEGMPAARRALARLSGAGPWKPGPRLWWLATWLPRALVRPWARRGLSPEDLATLPLAGSAWSAP